MFVGAAWAGPTDLPELSTEGNIKLYTIKNVRGNAYAAYDGDGESIKLRPTAESAASLFYFTEGTTTRTFKIHNYATDSLCAGVNSWNDEGIDWYMEAYTKGSYSGLWISKTDTATANGDAWNDYQNKHTSVAWYNGQDEGSLWAIEKYEGATPGIQLSTENDIKLHYIRSIRRDSYVNFDGHNSTFKEGNLGAGSYWYFVQDTEAQANAPEGFIACKIFNAAYATGVKNFTSGYMEDSSWPAKVFYIGLRENNRYGYVIHLPGESNGWHDFGGTHIGSYGLGDDGSLWRIYPSGKTAADLIAEAKVAKESAASLMPVAKEAYYYSYPDTAIAAAETAIASFSEENLTVAMSSQLAIEKALKEKRTEAPAVGDLIILKNKSNGKLLTDNDGYAKVNTNAKEKLAVWEVVAGEKGVKLKNYDTGKYLGSITQSEATSTVAEDAEGIAEFEWSNQKDVYAVFKPVEGGYYQYGHHSGGNLVGWEPGADATHWIATKVCNLSVSYIYKGNTVKTTNEYVKVGTYTVSSPYDFTKITACKKGEEALEAVNGVFSFELTESTTLTVELGDNLPFVPAADINSITKWYYLKFHANNLNYLYNAGTSDVLDATKTVVDANDKDAYTWAFIGNPIDGFKVYNKKGPKYLDAGKDGAIVSDAAQDFVLTVSPHAEKGFYMQAKDGDYTQRFNKQGGKVVYWSSADAGSTFVIEERDMSGRAELQALIDAVEKENYEGGESIGYYTKVTVDALKTALATAKEALNGDLTAEIARTNEAALQEAINNLEVILPVEDKYYVIESGIYQGDFVYAGADNLIYHSNEKGDAQCEVIWQFIDNEDGTFSLYSVSNNQYISQLVWQHPSKLADATTCKFTIHPQGGGKVFIKGNGHEMHAQGTNKGELVYYNTGSKGNASSWVIKEAKSFSKSVTVGATEWATLVLGYNATIPAGLKAYAVTSVEDDKAMLTEMGGSIPAGEAVLLNAKPGDYAFVLAESATAIENNMLKGTLFDKNITEDAYILASENSNVGFYKVKFDVNTDTTNDIVEGEGEAATTTPVCEAFKNNAFKAYLPATPAGARFLGFDFGTETGIGEVETETENAVIYDLSGRRVQKAQKGLYIVNGKKIIK